MGGRSRPHSLVLVLVVMRSHNPGDTRVPPVWALPISIASTLGISIEFIFLTVLRCVTSRRSLNSPLCIQGEEIQIALDWVVPFGDPRIRLCAAPLGFSQLTTSFIASKRQDIPHIPLVT